MPAEAQIGRWEMLKVLAKRDDEHNFLVNRIPLDAEHQEWLQSRSVIPQDPVELLSMSIPPRLWSVGALLTNLSQREKSTGHAQVLQLITKFW